MKRSSRIIGLALCAAFLLLISSPEMLAQKKKTGKETPAPTQTSTKSGGDFHEWLTQHQGYATNLGTLQKIGPDYIVVDEEGTQTIIPVAMIQSVKMKKEKEEEEGPEKITLVIKLVSGD
jgi:hypothetical protein